MKQKRTWILCLCALVLLLGTASCGFPEDDDYEDKYNEEADCEALLEEQLGLLTDYVTEDEWYDALYLLEEIESLQEERLTYGEYEKSREEEKLLEELSRLYDDYTDHYLWEEEDHEYYDEDYEAPEEVTLATYKVKDDGALKLSGDGISDDCPWTNRQIRQVWKEIREILPDDCEDYIVQLVVFTDGAEETLAYVEQVDDYGAEWALAIDPADYADRDLFVETIIHEFFHCVTLNHEQVMYTDEPDVETYTEEYEEGAYCVYYEDSYVEDFYRQFWTDYIDDREVDYENEYFYLRHENDFVTDYAATMPTEDICESFAYFVLYGDQGGSEVWEQKINFFYDYPELVEYRDEIRANLGM